MKNILLLILIVLSLKLFAQHPDLQQGNWYVQNITINSVTTDIPNDPIDFPYAYLFFFNTSSGLVGSGNTQSFYQTYCNISFVGHVDYIGTDILEFIDFTISQDITNCSTELIDFMNLYVSFYNDEILEQFTYNISTETDNSKTLLVTNNNGDEIVYTNVFLNLPPQELSDNDWYLHNLIIDSIDNVPPSNNEILNISLSINEGDGEFFTNVCSFIVGSAHFDYDNSAFYMYEIATDYGMTLCSPTYPINNSFTDLYIKNFLLDNLPGPFEYSYSENAGEKTLLITNNLGNKAIYKNWTLAVSVYKNTLFSISPNPVENLLTISGDRVTDIKSIHFYNYLGQKVLTANTANKVDLSILNEGVYLLKIELKTGQVVVDRIIKK